MGKFAVEIKWAILFTAASLLWTIFEKSMGWHDVLIGKQPLYSNLFGFVALTVYFLAMREKKNEVYNGNMDWKQGMVFGVWLSFFVALASPVSQFVFVTYISPEFYPNMIDHIVNSGRMKREDAELFFSFRSTVLQNMFTTLSFGVITAALVALVVQTKNVKK